MKRQNTATITQADFTILTAIKNHKRLVATITLVTFIFTGAYSLLSYVPQYKSSASVVVKDSALTAKYLTEDQYLTTSSVSSNPVLNTMELLKSDVICNTLWNEVILKAPSERKRLNIQTYTEWKEFFGNGKSFIKAKNVPGTDVIYLDFSWDNGAYAQKGMQSVLNGFQLASLEQNQSEHRQRYTYLQKQTAELKTRLADVRQNLANYKKSNRINNLDTAMLQYEQNRSQMDNSSRQARAEAQNYRSQLEAYQASLGMNTRTAVAAVAIGRSNIVSDLQTKLYQMEQERKSFETRYTADNPKMQQLDSGIKQIRASIQEEISRNSGANSSASSKPVLVIGDETRSKTVQNLLEVEARFRGAQAQSAGLKRSLNEIEAKLQSFPGVEAGLADLKQEEVGLSNFVDAIEQKTMDARLREAQTLSNVFPLSKPSFPTKPQFPDKGTLTLLGLVVGLMAGITTAYALDLKKQSTAQTSGHYLGLEELLAIERRNAEHQKEAVQQEGVLINGSSTQK